MKKIKIIIACWILFLILYNTVVFLLPVEHKISFYTAYAFSIASLLAAAGISLRDCSSERPVKSRFLDISIVCIGLTGLLLQVVWGILSMIFPVIPTWLVTLICVILLGATGILTLLTEAGVSWIKSRDAISTEQILAVNTWKAALEAVLLSIKDEELLEAAERLMDILRYTDPVSRPSTEKIDKTIADQMEALNYVLDKGKKEEALAVIRRTEQLVKEREIQCKAGK